MQRDRNELELTALAREPGNKTCFSCTGPGSLAPRSVCMQLGVFVCTRCSGIFRDFNFRIKSISASTFTNDEVAMLKSQGNDLARRTFLARYQDRLPTCGDTVRGKTFIKEACVDRRYYDDGTASAAAPVQQTAAAPVAAQPAAQTSAPDLFGGLFDAPQPVQQTAPPAQAPMPTSAPAPTPSSAPAPAADIWNAFDAPAPQAAQPSAVPAFAPPPAAPRPATQQQPAPAAPAATQPDLFGGLTIETPAAQPAAQPAPVEVSTSVPSRAALEEDFWSMPQAPQVPPQAQMQMPGMHMPQQQMHMPPQMQMPGMPGMQMHPQMQMPQQHMQMPGMQMPGMSGMQMPQQHMQMPQQHMQMPGMQMPGMRMPGMQMPQQQMQMPGMQMPGMQMPGVPPQMQAPAQAPQPAQPPAQAQEEPEEPDPFASFGALTGIPSKVTKKPETNGACAVPPPVDFVSNTSNQEPAAQPAAEIPTAAPVNPPSNGMSMEPPVAQPAAVPVNAMPMPTEKPANLGSMGFPLPASRPPEPVTDAHQAMMFEDMKNHTAGDSFSFAPVDSPPHSVVEKPVQPPVAAAQPVAAQATAAATQYSADNPFAFF